MRKTLCSIFAVGMLTMASASATIMVDFEPWDAYIYGPIGDTVEVEIWADIPEADAILGWGLDLIVDDPSIADVTGTPVIGGDFYAGAGGDGDGLAGLAFPDPIWGPHVTLATVTFERISPIDWIWTDIWMDATEGDLKEGFLLADGINFADWYSLTGYVNTPEPASLTMLALFGLALRRR